jgi:hypothetical protein
MSEVTIRYAKKPWDRGDPLTRTVKVPEGYTERQVESWLYEKQLMKAGEKMVAFHKTPNNETQLRTDRVQTLGEREEDSMSIKSIRAIELVLLVNTDICELYEKRGVTRDDLRFIFDLAIKYKQMTGNMIKREKSINRSRKGKES